MLFRVITTVLLAGLIGCVSMQAQAMPACEEFVPGKLEEAAADGWKPLGYQPLPIGDNFLFQRLDGTILELLLTSKDLEEKLDAAFKQMGLKPQKYYCTYEDQTLILYSQESKPKKPAPI